MPYDQAVEIEFLRIKARMLRAEIIAAGMASENQMRLSRGLALAYSDADFIRVNEEEMPTDEEICNLKNYL